MEYEKCVKMSRRKLLSVRQKMLPTRIKFDQVERFHTSLVVVLGVFRIWVTVPYLSRDHVIEIVN